MSFMNIHYKIKNFPKNTLVNTAGWFFLSLQNMVHCTWVVVDLRQDNLHSNCGSIKETKTNI